MLMLISSVQFTSVTQSCPTLCNPMNRSTPGLPVHHHLPEFTQTHVHRVSDANQPSHPLFSFSCTFLSSIPSLLFFFITSVQFSHSVMSNSATPWITAHQASLSITSSRSSLRLKSIESVMPSSHLILCHPLLLLPPIPPSIRVFSNESTLRMRLMLINVNKNVNFETSK